VLEQLEGDAESPTEEEVYARFGFELDHAAGSLSAWQRLKPVVWRVFDDASSTIPAKVAFGVLWSSTLEHILFRKYVDMRYCFGVLSGAVHSLLLSEIAARFLCPCAPNQNLELETVSQSKQYTNKPNSTFGDG